MTEVKVADYEAAKNHLATVTTDRSVLYLIDSGEVRSAVGVVKVTVDGLGNPVYSRSFYPSGFSEEVSGISYDGSTDALSLEKKDTDGGDAGLVSLPNFKDLLNLDNVDNTADADKPISTATQQAIGAVENKVVTESTIDSKISTAVQAIDSNGGGILGETETMTTLPVDFPSPEDKDRVVVNDDGTGKRKSVYRYDSASGSWIFVYSMMDAHTHDQYASKTDLETLEETVFTRAQINSITDALEDRLEEKIQASSESIRVEMQQQTENKIHEALLSIFPQGAGGRIKIASGTMDTDEWVTPFENFKFRYSKDGDMFHVGFPKTESESSAVDRGHGVGMALFRERANGGDNWRRVEKYSVKKEDYYKEQTHFCEEYFHHENSAIGYVDNVTVFGHHHPEQGHIWVRTLNHGDKEFSYLVVATGIFGVSDWREGEDNA